MESHGRGNVSCCFRWVGMVSFVYFLIASWINPRAGYILNGSELDSRNGYLNWRLALTLPLVPIRVGFVSDNAHFAYMWGPKGNKRGVLFTYQGRNR